ncbi:MAG: hypothetical protein ABI042_09055 [Verrucomicrobiota bacterium]
MKHQSQRGVALVITLIMLSVITFLTVAFLAVTRRDRASVTQSLNQTDSHLMADTALARFQAELVSGMMARGTLGDYELMLTRNYIRVGGYTNQPLDQYDTNNVNYDFQDVGGPLSNDQRIRNIANLYFDPRPPVFARNADGTTEFRFFLDYNRNGRFETNGFQPVVIDELGNTNGTFKNFLGEPEWIGVLQNPELPHGPNNRFVGRYLYLALPIGKTLDWNYIHNYAKGDIGLQPDFSSGDGFLRNQGFSSHEINLAGFLVDLNTNMYVRNAATPYQYFPDTSLVVSGNTGDVFNDAVSFLKYRYNGNFNNLSSVNTLFGGVGQTAFQTDFIDGYSTKPILVPPYSNQTDPDYQPPNDLTTRPWSGADNKARFINPQELFDSAKSSPNFVGQLQRVSTNNNSYDRYTFQRLLEQIGMGSEPEVKGKININYVNDPTLNTVNTNFVDWTAVQFFTNVAARLFKDNLVALPVSPTQTNFYLFNTNNPANLVRAGFSYANIQIYPTNEYTAPVHRLLQLAANVYDATTTNKYPTLFRPQVYTDAGQTIIKSFVAETNSQFLSSNIIASIQEPTNVINPDGLVWGVPMIIGTKKGFPNFNKFVMQTSIQISRNLQIRKRDRTTIPPVFTRTNQQLFLGVSNSIALEAWNSYVSAYNKSLRVIVTNTTSMSLTNQSGVTIWPANGQPTNSGVSGFTNFLTWPGVLAGSNAYYLPIGTNSMTFLADSQFTGGAVPFTSLKTYSTNNIGFPVPTWTVVITNRLLYVLIDTSEPGGRVVDFVNLANLNNNLDIADALSKKELNSRYADLGAPDSFLGKLWDTNRIDGSGTVTVPTKGVEYQISVSMEDPKLGGDLWDSLNPSKPTGPQRESEVDNFLKFMGDDRVYDTKNQTIPPGLSIQTPFNPAIKFDQTAVWAINDPLVHYMAEDLKNTTNSLQARAHPTDPPPTMYLKNLSPRYRPWGGNRVPFSTGQQIGQITDNTAYDFTVKDPRVRWSDDWDFPTNKFPSIGWLGRVHRGTPWQTVYLKGSINTNWFKWAGHNESNPTNDWKLMDVFTASPNDNASRGLLSVNQTNVGAWSAVLSGVVGLRNSLNDTDVQKTEPGGAQLEAAVIQPNSPELFKILNDINETRRTQFGGVFQNLGQILAVPSLSASYTNLVIGTVTNNAISPSPFLNIGNSTDNPQANEAQRYYGITDEAVERIPRQIMSLLKLGEARYVVYCYGQSLKPANNSLVLSAPAGSGLFNLCTNYQITGEVLTRSLLKVEGTTNNPRTVIENYSILPAD